MAEFSFKDFRFEDSEKEIIVHFLKIFFFKIDKKELEKIGKFSVKENFVIFPKMDEDNARKLFMRLVGKGFLELKNKISGNKTLYIHKNSGIPLIGSLAFGIVDKGTDMLEIKPITSCNIDCTYCSVDEGLSTKKTLDIVVERDYLVEEVKKLLEFKKKPIHIYINPHGEPLLYADIVEVVAGLHKLDYVKGISIITNGTLITESLADELIKAGLTAFNVSICSLEPEKAKMLAGTKGYDIKRIIDVLSSIKDKLKIVVSPVYMRGINDKDMEELAAYCKENGFELLVQNFQYNKRGRKPVKEIDFVEFFSFLREIEKKYGIELIKKEESIETRELPKPFFEGQIIEGEVFSSGRYLDESLAIAGGRIITISEQFTKRKKMRVKITGNKNNVFYGIKA
jgi:uncharacterized Fe-S cluster-containing radical SAM superfamily enzyme